MNGKTTIAAFAFAGMFGAAGMAAAQDQGLYVGASVGAAEATSVCDNATNCDDGETGYKGFVGYQVNKYFGAEAGFQYFGMFGRNSQGIATTAFDLVAVGSYPVMDKLSVYARLGGYYGSMNSKPLSEDKFGATYGVGAEYGMSREVGLRLDWQRYDNVGGGSLGFSTDIDVLSVGIVWRPR